MKICKKCIQPDTRPDIYFNENGVCGACLWEDEKKYIDWNVREKELFDIVTIEVETNPFGFSAHRKDGHTIRWPRAKMRKK